jgi:hypothetical protein
MATVAPRFDHPRAAPDPRIVHPLDRLRGYIRRFVVYDGLLTAALFLVAWFWIGLALDFGLFKVSGFDWVQDAPRGLRAAALALLAVALVAIVATRVVLRLTREFSYPSLALVLEKRYPAVLGDRLITAVELADVRGQAHVGYSPQMIERTIAEARDAVETVPVREVFNWRRLWRRLLLVAVLMAALTAVWYGLAAAFGRVTAPGEFAWRSGDVAAIWAERNLLLRDTPWPRRAHLELLDVSDAGLRVGKNDAPPKIRVRAYEWVTAAPGSRDGWRPLRWSDLTPDLLGDSVSPPASLTVADEGDWSPTDVSLSAVAGGVRMASAVRPVAHRAVPLTDKTADEVFAAFPPAAHPETAAVHDRLDELAARPAMSRTLRRLAIPDAVTLTYRGLPADPDARGRDQGSTSGSIRLTREPNGDFSAEVAGLKESVSFVVRAEDYRTAPRDIILVPPPMLTRLYRVESQPAYLFHPAPQQTRADGTLDAPRFELLKGLRQVLGEKDLSLTGDRSVCSVPAGTDLVLTGIADKPLAEVYVQPRAGRVPGAPPGSTAPVPIPVDGDHFTVRFTGDDRVMQSAEFELVMVDHDGVRSARPVLVQSVDDQAPTVEVAVDVLRKVGNTYLCTPSAQVPFVKESIVRDDTGLSKVEYQFTVTRIEAQVVVGLQLQAVAGIWAFAPVVPNLGSALGPTASAVTAAQLSRGDQKQFGALPVAAFDRAYQALRPDTLALLNQKLAAPPQNPDAYAVVRDVRFTLDGDVFDLETADRLLEARGHKLRVTDPGEVQPRFRIDLDVVATDVNVETGPKQGRNLEPIRLLVVSEADLLAEIGKDEESLIGRLDEALRKLADAQTKFNQQADRLSGPDLPPDLLLSARVRAEDIIQDVGKARELTRVVAAEYTRLRREVETNRVALERDPDGRLVSRVGQQYWAWVIDPLEKLHAAEFKAAEDALAAYRDPLLAGARPDDPALHNVRSNLALLISALQAIRNRLGESISVNKLRDDLRKIIENQRLVSAALDGIKRRVIESLFAPEIRPVAAIALARGEKKTVRHAVNWNVYDKDDLAVRVEPQPGSGITGPGEITVSADLNEFEYELTAGDKPGDYTVRVIPAVGNPVEVKVTVK